MAQRRAGMVPGMVGGFLPTEPSVPRHCLPLRNLRRPSPPREAGANPACWPPCSFCWVWRSCLLCAARRRSRRTLVADCRPIPMACRNRRWSRCQRRPMSLRLLPTMPKSLSKRRRNNQNQSNRNSRSWKNRPKKKPSQQRKNQRNLRPRRRRRPPSSRSTANGTSGTANRRSVRRTTTPPSTPTATYPRMTFRTIPGRSMPSTPTTSSTMRPTSPRAPRRPSSRSTATASRCPRNRRWNGRK
mmetsp:Transcript_34751/g.102138  ORF Transcript_34751/g.102138 Transcript_34751/m.102138 type:complete len:243 (+) Transcript_34751:249-977(+)